MHLSLNLHTPDIAHYAPRHDTKEGRHKHAQTMILNSLQKLDCKKGGHAKQSAALLAANLFLMRTAGTSC